MHVCLFAIQIVYSTDACIISHYVAESTCNTINKLNDVLVIASRYDVAIQLLCAQLLKYTVNIHLENIWLLHFIQYMIKILILY